MKREELKKIEGLTDETIDKIMALNGQDIESWKGKLDKVQADLTAANSQVETLTNQVAEAGKQIEAFKGMDVEGVKRTADEWKAKAEQAQKDAQAQLAALKFEHSLEAAIGTAKAKNPKAVRALLNAEALKQTSDGAIVGLDEQLKKLQETDSYLFETATADDPKIVDKTVTTTKPATSGFLAAVYKGAGMKPPE